MANDDVFLTAISLYSADVIEEEEFLLLVAASKETASVFPYWKYPRFSLCCVNEDDCLSEFRFEKNDLPRLVEGLKIPNKIVCPNGTTANAIEGLCILL